MVAIGAEGDKNDNESNRGTVYLFSTERDVIRIVRYGWDLFDCSAIVVAISGDRLYVGSVLDNNNGINSVLRYDCIIYMCFLYQNERIGLVRKNLRRRPLCSKNPNMVHERGELPQKASGNLMVCRLFLLQTSVIFKCISYISFQQRF